VRWTPFLLGSALLTLACAGGDGSTAPPAASATLSGVVQEESSGVGIAGATVTAGGVSTSSAQDGTFELRNVSIGDSVAVAVTATGFDAFSRTMAIHAGTNTLSVSLARRTIWEARGFAIYLPPGVSVYRGVFLFLGGSGGTLETSLDTRPFVKGDFDYYLTVRNQRMRDYMAAMRPRVLAFARAHALGVMGASVWLLNGDSLVGALNALAPLTGHAELARAPALLYGVSFGGALSCTIANEYPERVIGFMSDKGGCQGLENYNALSVPGYFFIGGADTPERAAGITEDFEYSRALGAAWALAIEPGMDHFPVADSTLMFDWLTEVFTQRVPENVTSGDPVTLRAANPQSGWLGDRTSHEIADYGSFQGDRLTASWLPSEQTARDWRAMVTRPGQLPGDTTKVQSGRPRRASRLDAAAH
jgi:pimeloyl-ACP methyl ester carboxylesterase